MAQILVVDDEVGIRELLSEILADEGYEVTLAENAGAARAARAEGRPDLVLLDIWMPDSDGITLLKEWAASGQLTMPVIMMSGHGTIDSAVEATRIGAADFLEKPIGMQKLLASVRRALHRVPQQAATDISLAAFPRSAAFRDLRRRLEQVAAKSRGLLLKVGQGSIAELAARTLHAHGRPFVDLALLANPLDLHALEAAQGGVLFIPDLSKLSRAQQRNAAFAAERLERYDLRLVGASALLPEALAEQGLDDPAVVRAFGAWVSLPSLAELRDEIPELAGQLLAVTVEVDRIPVRRFSTAALNALRNHAWTGGYAELKAAVRSLALGALEEEIDAEEVTQLLGERTEAVPGALSLDLPLREAREAFERMYFEHHLRADGGNMTRLAERTGLERTHLYRKLKQLGVYPTRRSDETS